MTKPGCARAFEVEALRDGRLGERERRHFERHLASCLVCSREAAALERLARALRDEPSPATDQLHLRRERTRLLAAFDRALIAPSERSRRRPLLLAAVVAALGLLVTVLSWHALRTRTSAPLAVVRAQGGAAWSRQLRDGHERIVLERGALAIQVSASSRKLPLLVVLPDGELEDIGTTFSVLVEQGSTKRVAVEEGSVLLRLRGRGPVTIQAGGSWVATTAPAASEATLSNAAAEPPMAASATPSATRPLRQADTSAPVDAASLAFRAAVAELQRGEHQQAAESFARFAARHPRDPRAEDAAYLRVLSLRRSGDTESMKSAAREYLNRHPSGFRRSEVEALLD